MANDITNLTNSQTVKQEFDDNSDDDCVEVVVIEEKQEPESKKFRLLDEFKVKQEEKPKSLPENRIDILKLVSF